MIKKRCKCLNTYCINYQIEFIFHRPDLTKKLKHKCQECGWNLTCIEDKRFKHKKMKGH